MNENKELLDKLKEFLTEEEIKQGIEKGVIKVDIEKGDPKMPFTEKTAGLETGTGPVKENPAPMANWEMVKTTLHKALDVLEKACEDMSQFVEKADYKESEDEEMDKAYGRMMGTADQMKKQMKMYKGRMMSKGDNMPQYNKENMMPNKMKSESEAFEQFEKSFGSKLENVNERNNVLEKSIKELTDTISTLKEDLGKISKETPAPKSVNLKAYIEKGGVKDEAGKKIYHVGMHREQILSELEKARNDADDIMKGQIDDDIMEFASAGIAPSEKVAQHMYDKHNIKLVK